MNRLATTGSGISQIKSPWARIPLQIADALGRGLFPGIEMGIPGTSGHHDVLMHQQAGRLADIEGGENDAAKRAQEVALTRKTNADAALAENPEPAEPTNAFQLWHQQNPEGTLAEYNAENAKAAKEGKPDLHAMYADAVADALDRGVKPTDDPKVKQLAEAMQEQLRQPAPKEPNKDAEAVRLYAKQSAGEELTPQETAYLQGFEKWNKTTKTDPGVARMTVLMNGRPVQVVDPNNPENLVYDRAGHAIESGASTPGSIPFQTDKALQRSFTSGTYSQQLNAINTARYHMETFKKLATALNNGDMQGLNAVSLAWQQQFGSPAPTNFNLAKEAFSNEVARAFSVTNVTEGERNKVAESINRASSPKQLQEAAQTADELLEGKQKSLKATFESGKQGRPNFGETTVPTVNSKADFDKIPSGAFYMEDGKKYRKP